MLIEQIVEFEVRGMGPLVVHVLLQLVIFMTKQKSLRNIFEWIILLFTSKILQEAMHITFPYLGQITNKILSQIQDFKRVLDLNC